MTAVPDLVGEELLRGISATTTLREAAPVVLAALAGAGPGWDAAALWVLDREATALLLHSMWSRPGVDAGDLESVSLRRRVNAGEGLPGRVWARGEAEVSDDIRDDGVASVRVAAAGALRSVVAFPLTDRGRLFGVVELFSRRASVPDGALVDALVRSGGLLGQLLERRRASEQLLLERERLDLALEAASLGTWDWDLRRRTTSWSATTATVLGLPVGGGDDGAVLRAVHPDDRSSLVQLVAAAVADRSSFSAEHRVVHPDGTLRWVESRGRVIVEDDEVVMVTGVVLDVTERRRAAAAAERAAERTSRLLAVTTALLEAPGMDRVVEVVLTYGAAALSADRAVVALLTADGTALEVAGATYDPEVVEPWTRIPADAALPLTEAVRTGRLVVATSREEYDARYPEHAGALQPATRGVAAVPMTVGGRPIGAIGLSFEDDRTFESDDMEFMANLGAQCALGCERARLYEAERRARDEAEAARARVAFLAGAGEALAGSLHAPTILATAARLAVPRLADWAGVSVVDDDGTIRRFGVHHADPGLVPLARRFWEDLPFDAGMAQGVTQVLTTGEPVLVANVRTELLGRRLTGERLEMVRRLGLSSALVVPLVARGRIVAALSLVRSAPDRPYDAADLELAGDLARRAALAADNARLFSERSHVARTLQRSLLPQVLPAIEGIDLGARYVAAGEDADVGGDFYDVFAAGQGSWAVVIGDVCGKGADAAGVTALARYTTRALAIHDRDPAAILTQLNTAILQQNPSEERFFTVAYAVLDPRPDGVQLEIASGGHPLPLVVRAAGGVSQVGRPGRLLGVLEHVDVVTDRTALASGDLVVFYTDGVVEAHGAAGLFGDERLRATVVAAAGAGGSADDVAGAVADAVAAFRVGPGADDMAVLVLRVR